MANINTIFLKWDGACFAAPKTATPTTDWCNSRDVGDGTATVPRPESVEPSLSPHHGFQGIGAPLEAPRAALSMVAMDKVFAPAEEYALVQLKMKNMDRAGQLIFQVRDSTGALVYAERLTRNQLRGLPATRELALAAAPRWASNGQDDAQVAETKRSERAKRAWATPEKSPYRVTVLLCSSSMTISSLNKIDAVPAIDIDPSRLDKDTSKCSVPPRALIATADVDQTSVAVHSVDLELMPWGDVYKLASAQPNLDYPTGKGTSVETKWVQYKLNELGFFAGSLDGDPSNAELKKAVVRYRQADPDLLVKRYIKDGFVFVLDPAVIVDDTITTALVDKLKGGAGARSVISEPKVVTGEEAAGRLYIDADRLMQDAVEEFAFTKREETLSLKSKYERAWYSPPRVPVRAKVSVKGRGGDKKWVPESVGAVPVEWSWTDAAQDVSALPDFKVDEPSRSKEYLTAALERVSEVYPADYNNVRVAFGGQISGDPVADRGVVFQQLGAFALTPGGQGDAWGARTVGGAVYFTPSTIAGDNYKLQAKAGTATRLTGKIEVWRRVKIACHVSWSAAPPSAVWAAVAKEYEPAFIEVTPPAVMRPLKDVADLTLKSWFLGELATLNFPMPDRKFADDYYDPRDLGAAIVVTKTNDGAINDRIRAILDANGHLAAWEGAGTQNPVKVELANATTLINTHWRNGKDATLSDLPKDALLEQAYTHFNAELARIKMERKPGNDEIPLDVRGKGLAEMNWKKANTTTVFKAFGVLGDRALKPFVSDPAVLHKAQRDLVDQKAYHGLVNPTQVDLMLQLRRIVGPGVMVLEIDPHAPVQIGGKDYVSLAIPSLSPGGEVVLFNRAMYGAYKLYMLFAHEMAHCFFLKHHKNADPYSEWDHDQRDENCMMSYAYEAGKTGNFVRGVGDHYKDGNFTPHFCGKCNLLLRGWNLRAKDPKNSSRDVLPDFTGMRPLPRLKRAEGPVDVPSPALIQTASVNLMKGLVGEDDVGKYWLKGTGVSETGRVMAIANPYVNGERIEWEVLPMRSFPEGTLLGKPHSDLQVPAYSLKHSEDSTDPAAVGGWEDAIKLWSETAALTADAGVPLVVSCPGYGFTDLMHEACHFFQKWSTSQGFYEGVTEVFANMLSLGVRSELGALGQGAHDAKFAYSFNLSYSEVTLSAIDKWLPRLGLRAMGEIYVKEESTGRFDAMFRDKTAYYSHLLDVTRDDLHLRDLMAVDSSADPLVSPQGALRADLEEKVAAAGPLEGVLRGTITAFLTSLDDYASRVSTKQRLVIDGKVGLAKTYAKARMVRLTAKQQAKLRVLREARYMKDTMTKKEMAFLGTQLDKVILDTSTELNALCVETQETEEELLRVLPVPPYVPPV